MALNTYGHVIEELAGATRQSAEEAIRSARDKLVPLTYPQRSEEKKRTKSNPAVCRALRRSRRPDSNRGPLHYEERAAGDAGGRDGTV